MFINAEKVTLIDGWLYYNTQIELYNNPLIVPFAIFGQQEVNYYFPKAKQVNRKGVPEKLYLVEWRYTVKKKWAYKTGDLLTEVQLIWNYLW